MKLTGKPTIIEFDPFATESAAAQTIGEPLILGDQRVFRYSKAGAVATSPGKMETAPAPKTQHHNLAVTATAINAVTVNVTLGSTAAAADEYDEGFMSVNVTPAVGQTLKIYYNPAIALSVAGNITLSDPLTVAFTTATKVSLVHNANNGFIEAAVATTRAAGVGLIGAAIGGFQWLQTGGVSSVLADGTIALGSLIGVSASVAGGVVVNSGTYATALATTQVGQANIMAGVTTEYRPMFLTIN